MIAQQRAAAWHPGRWLNTLLIVILTFALAGCNLMAPFLTRPTLKQDARVAAGAGLGSAAAAAATNASKVPGVLNGTPADSGTLAPESVPAPGLASAPTVSSGGFKVDNPVFIRGVVQAPRTGARYAVQAVDADVVGAATVTLIAASSQAVASGLTDSAGNFNLSLSGWIPATNGLYVLEAVKGLGPNKPGSEAVRFRTVVKWDGTGWLSCTNTVPTPTGIVAINALTTAVALEIALDSNLSLDLAIGKVNLNTSTLAAAPAFPGHLDSEIVALANDITGFLTNDVDPVGSVGAIKPNVTSLSSSQGFPGSLVTITGKGFLPVAGGNTVKFSNAVAPIFLATPTKLIVGVPAGASSGNLTVSTTRGGTSNGLPFNVTAGVSIQVKTNGIIAPYYVSGAETVAQTGSRNVTVYPGTTQVVFTTGQAATFVVAADGAVDALLSGGALTGAAGEIQFNTRTLSINPNGYAGNYILSGGFMPSSITGNGSALVLKGLLGYRLQAGSAHTFGMDSDGTVNTNGSWATGTVGSLVFTNINLEVKANGYVGTWSVGGVTPEAQTGNVTLVVPKDSVGYVFYVMGTAFTFDVSGTGTVTTTSSYATGVGSLLTLAIMPVAVDAKGFTGMWHVPGVTNGWQRDNQSVVMMKNFNYRMTFWPGNSYVAFGLDGDGNITIKSAGGQATTNVMSSPSLGNLAFNVDDVSFNAGDWKGYYGVLYGSTPGNWTWIGSASGEPNWVIGNKTFKVLKGMTNYYYLYFYPGTAEHYMNLNVADNGLVTAAGTGPKVTTAAAILGTRSVQLNTSLVPVSANGWTGYWGFLYGDGPSRGWAWLTSDTGDPNWIIGNRNFRLIKGLVDYYHFNFWPGANGNYHLTLSLDSGGNITEKPLGGPVSADALNSAVNSITINTADVTTDTGGWGGLYGMFYGTSPQQGWTWLPTKTGDPNWVFNDKTYKLIRGIKNYYYLWFYPGGTNYYLTLDLPGSGDTLAVGLAGSLSTSAALQSTTNRTLKFATMDVNVDTGGWKGNYGFLYGHGPQQGWSWLGDGTGNPNWVFGNRPYKLLKGLVDYYHFGYWPDPTKYRVVLNIDSGGLMSKVGNGGNATQDALSVNNTTKTLTIPTRTLTVNEGDWEGYWGFLYGAGPAQGWTWLTSADGQPNWVKKLPSQPNTTFTMVKGLTDYFFLYFWPGAANMYLNLSLKGDDTLEAKEIGGPVHKEVATLAGGTNPSVTFNTDEITLDPNGFKGHNGIMYGLSASQGWTWVPTTAGDPNWVLNNQIKKYRLLRGIDDYYFNYFYPGAADNYVQFKTDKTTGNVSYVGTGAKAGGTNSVLYSGKTIQFKTQTVTVNANGYRGLHGFLFGNGPQTGWTWLASEAGDPNWVYGTKSWKLIKGMDSYFFHGFYPLGSTYYRTIKVDSNGAMSTPEGGMPVKTHVYSSISGTPASTLNLNVGTVSLKTGGWTGYFGVLYGWSPLQGWTWLYDETAFTSYTKYSDPTSTTGNTRLYKWLKGIENYYFLWFWPGGANYLNVDYRGGQNSDDIPRGYAPNSGAFGAGSIAGSANVVSLKTYAYDFTSDSGTPRWAIRYGDAISHDWLYHNQANPPGLDWWNSTSKSWRLIQDVQNYYYVDVEGFSYGNSFSTDASGNLAGFPTSFAGKTFGAGAKSSPLP